MSKLIQDEFTDLKVSKSVKWQFRQKKKGLCLKCNNPVVFVIRLNSNVPGKPLIYCEKHAIWNKNYNQARGLLNV